MTEIWKPIPGYVGKYEVSNLGNVRSVDHVLYQKDSHGGMMEKHYKGKPVAITDNGNGYKIVSLSNFGRKNHYVHRIVAEAFVENPNGYAVVNHLDYDTSNNAPTPTAYGNSFLYVLSISPPLFLSLKFMIS